MKLNKLEVLSKDEIETIHSASIKLMENVGIKIDAEDCRKLLQENGISTAEALAMSPSPTVAEIDGLGDKTAKKLIWRALIPLI